MAIEATDIRTYVLNLPRRVDRRERLAQALPVQLPVTGRWPAKSTSTSSTSAVAPDNPNSKSPWLRALSVRRSATAHTGTC
jgi:hypothetical protein